MNATSNPLWDSGRPASAGYRDLTPAAVHAAARTVRVVDVREPHEFNDDLGHVPGAELVPLATVPAQARGWDPAGDLIVVCRSGGRSGRAAEALVAAGFQRIMNLTGGMLAYRSAGLPVERS